jgi:hypothetical protein
VANLFPGGWIRISIAAGIAGIIITVAAAVIAIIAGIT